MRRVHTLLLASGLIPPAVTPALALGIPGPVMGDSTPGLIAALVLVAAFLGIRQYRRSRAQK